jgi:hypothetical protein
MFHKRLKRLRCIDRFRQHLDQMPRASPSSIGDLLAAARAHRHHLRRGRQRANRREQRALADRLRDRVVLGLIAERASHTATAAVDLARFGVRDHAQQFERVRRADQRLLMAVAVQQERPRAKDGGRTQAVL